jgi:hypothetical protein
MDEFSIDPEMKCKPKLPNNFNTNIGKVWWPQCFIDGQIPADRSNKALCADALTAWANCMAGHKPPETFGVTMQAIGVRLGCTPPYPKRLSALANTFLETPRSTAT